jgi:DnaK suppressor protein
MDADRAHELLALKRARIERALPELSEPERDEDVDPIEAGDAGPEMVDNELDEGLAERMRDELEAIERAEARLREGTYGISVESGEPIPDARLEAIPWAERTTAEQERYDGLGR